MKDFRYFFNIVLVCLVITGCTKVDNYEPPTSGVFGKVTDAETGKPLEIRQPGGGIIRMLQQDTKYPNPGPIDISLKADGQFTSSQFFAGSYKAFPRDGAFQYFGDSTMVTLPSKGMAELNFKVDPYYRVIASVADSTFSYTVTAPASNTSKMQEIIFMVAKEPVVNESVSSNTNGYYVNIWKKDVSGTPDTTLLGVLGTYTFNWQDTHLPKGEYYFRIGVRTSVAWYNYSPVIKATVH
jgi:hypothetical protein